MTETRFLSFQWHIKEEEKESAVLEGKSSFSAFRKMFAQLYFKYDAH